jgi:hypothetical protein
MIVLLFALLGTPARADTPHLPVEMQQKVVEAKDAFREGFRLARTKMHAAEKDSDFVHSVTSGIAHLWTSAKAHGRRAIVYLDRELHQHVLGPEEKPAGK